MWFNEDIVQTYQNYASSNYHKDDNESVEQTNKYCGTNIRGQDHKHMTIFFIVGEQNLGQLNCK